ncbi:hypothetical protein [Paraburkholderia haematera]|uniref:Uncharacterized protein n=1 Tax=Paraburkholderia haematera TaxID=2793077 RepID=A0ABM8QJZ4_9BURK|nr:hypothetical protein [Paraburkholderia haematera]CAE6700115.1 hypothetical protein R69888_00696 [Paraburkholderia haematera]
MERTLTALTGSTQTALIDQDIAHIWRVMRPSLHGDLAGPILPPTYWRKRLHQLLDTGNLSHAQLCGVDSLLLQLDEFEASVPPAWNELAPAAAALPQPPHLATASRHI